jgi:hypothetical protein
MKEREIELEREREGESEMESDALSVSSFKVACLLSLLISSHMHTHKRERGRGREEREREEGGERQYSLLFWGTNLAVRLHLTEEPLECHKEEQVAETQHHDLGQHTVRVGPRHRREEVTDDGAKKKTKTISPPFGFRKTWPTTEVQAQWKWRSEQAILVSSVAQHPERFPLRILLSDRSLHRRHLHHCSYILLLLLPLLRCNQFSFSVSSAFSRLL